MEQNVIECSTACTVTVVLEPAPAPEGSIEDVASMWGLFFVAAIVVMGLRKLYDLFDRGPHEG